MVLRGLQAVSLYANPSSNHNEGLLQWIMPECIEHWRSFSEDLPMKGMWNSEKSANATYRPGLDALSAVDQSLLASALHAVVSDGAALMVSATRDQGAICLTLLSGETRHRVYPSTVQELDQALRDLIESFAPAKSASKARPPTR